MPPAYTFGGATTCGRRPSNEDSHFQQQVGSLQLVGVFDGHGGASAAEYCSANIVSVFQQQPTINDNLPKALQQTFTMLDRNYIKQEGAADIFSSAGCTACVLAASPTQITVANAGDSRAVCGRYFWGVEGLKNKQLTTATLSQITSQVTADHKPSVATEKQRIEQFGSCVTESADDCARVAGMLAVSRAIGDAPFKGCGVIAQPEVYQLAVEETDFLVVACDGLWDVLANEEIGFVVNYVRAGATGTKVEVDATNQRLMIIKTSLDHFLKSENLSDEHSKAAEKELNKIAMLGGIGSDSEDVRIAPMKKDDKFSPANIARILAKMAVAIGSDDNVSVVVGVK